jgi:hypothetical protein
MPRLQIATFDVCPKPIARKWRMKPVARSPSAVATAFNCGAPAFRFTEERRHNDVGPRLVAMVREIKAALGGAATQSKKDTAKKGTARPKAGRKAARVVEGIR